MDSEKILLFSIRSYYFRLIHGLIASFLAFCSALGSWLMAGSSLVARRSAPVPFLGPGPALLLALGTPHLGSPHLLSPHLDLPRKEKERKAK